MKKIIITIVLLIAVNTIKAQGNLQFNQVKNIEVVGSATGGNATIFSTIGSITVPSGKVWKIESVTTIENTNPLQFGNIQNNILTLIGNHLVTSSQSTTLPVVNFPIWLSPGNYTVKCASTGGEGFLTSISAIEFNVTP